MSTRLVPILKTQVTLARVMLTLVTLKKVMMIPVTLRFPSGHVQKIFLVNLVTLVMSLLLTLALVLARV